jgi:tetratricopeptide (TPR) repeat protein
VTASDAQRTAGAVPAIWGSVPQRNKNFTGREDVLSRLRSGVSSKVTAVLSHLQPHALQGMGGVGKTALAVEYAHRYRSEYELIWWIPADQPALVRSSLAGLAGPLGLQSVAGLGIEGAATVVLDALRRGVPYRRWLLIFDNADQPEDLNDVIPRDGPGDVLITSRNHRWGAVVETVPVEVFTRDESTEFLTKRVQKGLSATEAGQLAEELGDLPLALEQAGALQAETGMPVEEYLRLLREHVGQIMEEGKSTEYPLSMTAAWRLSVDTLNRQLPQAMDLLRACAFFGPEPIPRDVFRPSSQVVGTMVGQLVSDPILLARAIRELGRFALVRIDGRAISVHRLIQALIRDALSKEDQAMYRHQVHLILAAGAPRNPDDNRQWDAFRSLVAHVSAAATGLAECHDPAVRNFALNVVRYLYRSGDRQSAHVFATRFNDQWTQDSGPENPAVLSARTNLGSALRELGHYADAFETTRSTLSLAQASLGERDPLTLLLTSGFGADLRARGEFVEAQKLDEEAVRLHSEVFGPDSAPTLRVKNNLALDYGLNSDYEQARSLQQSTYNLQNEASGDVTPTDMLISWSGLARAVRLCGLYYEARDVAQEAYEYGNDLLGPDYYWTLRALNDYAIALRRSAVDMEEALERAREVHERSSRRFGEGHPDSLAAAISLANILRATGDAEAALELAEATVASYPSIYGPDHPYSRGCEGNLALMLRVAGKPEKARELNETAWAALKVRLGAEHHYTLTVSTNLASDLAALNRLTDAVALGRSTLESLQKALGQDHPLTLGCAANLASDLRDVGLEEKAESLRADTLERYARTLGNNHPDAQNAEQGLRLDFDFDPPPI